MVLLDKFRENVDFQKKLKFIKLKLTYEGSTKRENVKIVKNYSNVTGNCFLAGLDHQ